MSKAPAKKTSLWQRLKDTVKDTVDPDRALMAATGSFKGMRLMAPSFFMVPKA